MKYRVGDIYTGTIYGKEKSTLQILSYNNHSKKYFVTIGCCRREFLSEENLDKVVSNAQVAQR